MKDIKERIDKYWSGRAEEFSYARMLDLTSDQAGIWLDVIKQSLPLKRPLKALDIGTGAGFFPFLLNELGIECIGIDYSKQMINQADKNKILLDKLDIVFKQMDAMNLQFEDESFDFIISRNVTWTLPDPLKAYKEMVRVLNKDGVILNFDANYARQFKQGEKDHGENFSYKVQDAYKYPYKHQTEEQIKERNQIASELYVSNLRRPSWDVDVLLELGMRKVTVDVSDFNSVYSGHPKEDNPYKMFKLIAVK